MTDAAIGYGSKFEIDIGGGFIEIAEVIDITPPNEKADVLEATNMQSPNGYKEFILGLTDPGNVSFTMNFLPGSVSETTILSAKSSRLAQSARITLPGAQAWAFLVLVTDYVPAVPSEQKMTCTVTGKVTGSVART